MDGSRVALVIANEVYADPGLSRLLAPARDAVALAEVLGDPAVGGFDVRVLQNESAQTIRYAVEDFFSDRSPEDLLLLHFSCHGLKNAAGELFLAVADTKPTRLASTAVAADFVNRQMADSRAQRIALFLDCCYGGAFPRGLVVRAAGEAQVRDAFAGQDGVGGGRGRVVVTASSAMEYAFEGGRLASGTSKPSVFTSAVVDGLTSGDADKDGDGWVGLTELVGYVTDRVHRVTPNQNPQMWTFGSQGELLIARSRVRRITPAALAPELLEAMGSPLSASRFGVVDYLRERLHDADLGLAYAAWQALQKMADDDSRKVSEAAHRALKEAVPQATRTELDLGSTPHAELHLSGPPIAQTALAAPGAPWIELSQQGPLIQVHATPPTPGPHESTITLTALTGTTTIPVTASAPTPTQTQPLAEAERESAPVAEAPAPEPVAALRPAVAPAAATVVVPWWVVGVLGVGAFLLVLANLPGSVDSRRLWSDDSNTGWRVYRSWSDPEILASLAGLAASLVARWAGRRVLVALGIALGCFASVGMDGFLFLAGGMAAEETTAWVFASLIALALTVIILVTLKPACWRLWPVQLPAAALVVAGGIVLLIGTTIEHTDGVSFVTVSKLVVLEPIALVAIAWLALAATESTAKQWLTVTAVICAVLNMVGTGPALTEGASVGDFLAGMVGSVLVAAGVVIAARRSQTLPT
ncbi:caspase, EACC1-associated type [Kribbella catacumbae]|uniref:caspase, EACC1-associated type n=1 Tax=Kribbella catacumbae TaxID=460086 RepID=UPI000365864D|nr:caspase family protein [Kribbella catacumbae]